jgi:biotin transporter BioY
MKEQALISSIIEINGNKLVHNLTAVFGGVILLTLLAHISIPLPFTPVPITGQTFGVTLISLLWGYKRGLATVASYLGLGFLGLPVFAGGSSSPLFGPTSGYLIGMAFSAFLVGFLADLGWTKSFLKTWLAAIFGSVIVFAMGLIVLAFFADDKSVLSLGLYPFIPGDLIKNFCASWIAYRAYRLRQKNT